MRALVFDKDLRFIEDHLAPAAADGEALVRVTLAGICATDLELVKGYMGFKGVLGHEFTGVVEECADPALKGKRVVGEINVPCDRCGLCKKGMGNHCPERTVLGILGRDGAFAEYLTLPERNLHIVPDSVTDEEAVFTEPLAAAFEIIEQVDLGFNDRVCVLGDGRLGLLVAQVLSLTGSELLAIGKHPDKLELLGMLGIRTALLEEFSEIKKSFDIVVDCTGRAGGGGGLEMAISLVRPRGTVVLKTTVAESGPIDLNRLVIDEITVVGSRCGPFPPAIRALEEDKVDVRPLINKRFPLEDGVEAFKYAATPGVLKVLLES
ncbi:MAG: alcohol dehydrogenase catalytic domain-containing protein [Thermodesulfobacteriota bacterium]